MSYDFEKKYYCHPWKYSPISFARSHLIIDTPAISARPLVSENNFHTSGSVMILDAFL